MARGPSGKDYFVGEPAMIRLVHGPNREEIAPVVIARWFQRTEHDSTTIYAKVHHLRFSSSDRRGYLVDGRVECQDVPLSDFLHTVTDMLEPTMQARYHLAPISNIEGIYCGFSLVLHLLNTDYHYRYSS